MTCIKCTVSTMCEECAAATPDVSQRQAAAAITQQEEMDARATELEEEQEGNEESDKEAEVVGGEDGDEEEDVASDAGMSQDDELEGEAEQEEEDISSPGSVVWVPWGRFRYPAKVVLLSEVPAGVLPPQGQQELCPGAVLRFLRLQSGGDPKTHFAWTHCGGP